MSEAPTVFRGLEAEITALRSALATLERDHNALGYGVSPARAASSVTASSAASKMQVSAL